MGKGPLCSALSDKLLRMLDDENYGKVSKKDVNSLLTRMKILGYPREEIIRMRIKYDAYLDDTEKKLMQKYGLDYEHHVISLSTPTTERSRGLSLSAHHTFLIDGYTVTQWRMLTDDDYFPPQNMVTRFINISEKYGDEEALQILEEKYAYMYEESARKYLISAGLDPNTPYETITWEKIDGVSFFVWKLLNQDYYVPKGKSKVISCIRQLRLKGESEKADYIESKYHDYLYPPKYDEQTKKELEEGLAYFRSRFLKKEGK